MVQQKNEIHKMQKQLTFPMIYSILFYNIQNNMQAEVKAHSDTLQEQVCDTITRDLKNILTKLKYVIIPKFNMQADAEGIKQLRNWDLWGPLILCLILSLVLNIGMSSNGNQFGIVFLVMWGGAFVVTINTKLLGGKISFFQCVCVLGYCVFPIVLAAIAVFILKQIGIEFFILKLIIAGVALVWSTMGSYSFMNVSFGQKQDKNLIAVYPIFLFYLFIAWFVIFI